MYIRKTRDSFNIYADYGYGLEYVCGYDTKREANTGRKEYLDNDKNFTRIIIRKEREKIY